MLSVGRRDFRGEGNSAKFMPEFLFLSLLPTWWQHTLRGSGKEFFFLLGGRKAEERNSLWGKLLL